MAPLKCAIVDLICSGKKPITAISKYLFAISQASNEGFSYQFCALIILVID